MNVLTRARRHSTRHRCIIVLPMIVFAYRFLNEFVILSFVYLLPTHTDTYIHVHTHAHTHTRHTHTRIPRGNRCSWRLRAPSARLNCPTKRSVMFKTHFYRISKTDIFLDVCTVWITMISFRNALKIAKKIIYCRIEPRGDYKHDTDGIF